MASIVIEIKKNTPPGEIRKILSKTRRQKQKKELLLASFFGKLPNIEDGMKFQKKLRNEWK